MKQNRDRIFGYAFYFLRNTEDAEDVAQDVFAKLWRHWSRINENGRVPFAMRIAHNECIDVTRRRKTSGVNERCSQWLDLDSIPAARSPGVDPEMHMEFTETQRALLSALEKLPERTKGMLLMHYFQGLKLETIGEILGVKTGTVKVTIHRGRALLRRELGPGFKAGGTVDSDEKIMQ